MRGKHMTCASGIDRLSFLFCYSYPVATYPCTLFHVESRKFHGRRYPRVKKGITTKLSKDQADLPLNDTLAYNMLWRASPERPTGIAFADQDIKHGEIPQPNQSYQQEESKVKESRRSTRVAWFGRREKTTFFVPDQRATPCSTALFSLVQSTLYQRIHQTP